MTAVSELPPHTRQQSYRQRSYLMCRPDYFAVSYAINPWMHPEVAVDRQLAISQWESLRQTYVSLGHRVETIRPEPGLPDMVFAANGALVIDGVAYGASFRHPERRPEANAYLTWMGTNGIDRTVEANFTNEGEGDFLLVGEMLLAGTGFRTDPAAHREAQQLFGRPVISLQLVDPHYYHLDTALAVLGDDLIAYLPSAFSPESQRLLGCLFPDAVIASEADAAVFGLNAVCDGQHVVLPRQAEGLAVQLAARGFDPVGVDLSELLKAGGSVKCCTLELRT
ncbi:arginine deiminase-related protein [Microlunatus panaciterrae]|uniref:N-dimethylarginine dimethylaminohydrolase n=1 Tax=Microlunatus panaciterrae TaxID=400768 RepID=A0ABS2RI78_9ACTN|nr:dimethylargininase [Microlunatus panaciterrae]MBM7798700.1 N-dimethylarginine dimethylaminohydrolase [Microlunatus panaciterrae]